MNLAMNGELTTAVIRVLRADSGWMKPWTVYRRLPAPWHEESMVDIAVADCLDSLAANHEVDVRVLVTQRRYDGASVDVKHYRLTPAASPAP
jgi:hypothetical protein